MKWLLLIPPPESENKYFGDERDYLKYGLMRSLLCNSGYKLLVAWMLTSDEDKTNDGKVRYHFNNPDEWKVFDEKLYNKLVELLKPPAIPNVSLIESSELLPNSDFYSMRLESKNRVEWWNGLKFKFVGKDLVFFDPDNGIEPKPSEGPSQKSSPKHISWFEIKETWKCGCSVLIFQYIPPFRNQSAFSRELLAKLFVETGASFTRAFKTSHVLYLFAAQEKHRNLFEKNIEDLALQWKDKIQVLK